MNTKTVLPLGTWVSFGSIDQEKYKGWIGAITIRKEIVCYEINYWLNDNLKLLWLTEDHFDIIHKVKKHRIGFADNVKEET